MMQNDATITDRTIYLLTVELMEIGRGMHQNQLNRTEIF